MCNERKGQGAASSAAGNAIQVGKKVGEGRGSRPDPWACRVREEVSQGSSEQKVSLALRNSFSKASLMALSSSHKNFKVHVLLPQRCPMPVL